MRRLNITFERISSAPTLRGKELERSTLAPDTPRELDFDPFASTFEIRQLSKSPFNEAALVFLLLLGSGICVLLVVFYAALRAVGLQFEYLSLHPQAVYDQRGLPAD